MTTAFTLHSLSLMSTQVSRTWHIIGCASIAAIMWRGELRSTCHADEIVSGGEVVAILSRAEAELPSGEVILWTGERLPGAVATSIERAVAEESSSGEVPEDVLLWRHPDFGVFVIPFESIRRVILVVAEDEQFESAAGASVTAGDLVVLANGDHIRGVVTRVGEEVVVESADATGAPREFPLDAVEAVQFVGVAESPGTPRYWLADGSIIDGQSPGGVVLAWQKKVTSVPADASVLRDRRRVQALSQACVVAPPDGAPAPDAPAPPRVERVLAESTAWAPLDAGRIFIDAPSALQAEMPFDEGVLSVVVSAPSVHVNAVLRVLQEGRVVAEVPLRGAAAEQGVGLGAGLGAGQGASQGVSQGASARDPRNPTLVEMPLRKGRFTIEVVEGPDGPVGDRVELREGLLIKGGGVNGGWTGRRPTTPRDPPHDAPPDA